MSPQIVTANRLRDGEVIYFTASGDWSEQLGDAHILAEEEAAENALALAMSRQEELRVVGPYLMDVAVAENRPRAIGQRETIRATGPTVHPHFGKQARAR